MFKVFFKNVEKMSQNFVETMACRVCKCYDPIITTPVKNPKQAEAMMTTEWIGCDCNRWYHKYCTKLKKIDDSFSCVQLGIECLPLSYNCYIYPQGPT